MLVYSDLVVAYFEALASDPASGATTGRFYLNTTAHVMKFYANGAWKTGMDLETAQSVTGVKTFTSPIINSGELDNSFVDGYLDFNEESAPATPSSGRSRLYVGTDGIMRLIDDGAAVTVFGAAGGNGEKNYISNASAATAITGWVAVGDFDLSRTTTLAELPREFTTATGIKIVANAGVQSVADYVYFDFTLDDVDLNKKLKIQWAQKVIGTYTAGQLEVVITSQADRTTVLHAALVPAIPSADFVLQTSFDSGSTATLSLGIRATADMTTSGGVVISDVIVGPGIQPQGAVVESWTSFTAELTASGGGAVSVGTGGNATAASRYRRVGNSMEIILQFAWGTSGESFGSSGNYRLTVPGGFTVDATQLPTVGGADDLQIGSGLFWDASASDRFGLSVTWNGSLIRFGVEESLTGANLGVLAPVTIANGDAVYANLTVPIAEWAGGTSNLAANDVEYAYNSSSSTSAETTLFAYGPAGVPVVAYAPTGTSSIEKRVRFATPISNTDRVVLEFNRNGSDMWVAASDMGFQLSANDAGTTLFGVEIHRISGSTTDVGVYFYSQAMPGSAWSALTTRNWRVRKERAGVAVGWGAATQNSLGLVKAGQVPGTNTNDNAIAGNVGEEQNITLAFASANGLATTVIENLNGQTFVLTPGEWEISGSLGFNASGSTTQIVGGLCNTSAALPPTTALNTPSATTGEFRLETSQAASVPGGLLNLLFPAYTVRVATAATVTLFPVVRATFSTSTMTAHGQFRARRVR